MRGGAADHGVTAGARPAAESALASTGEPVSDLRALEPPGPLLHVLERLEAGEGPHVFLLAREPVLLYPMLKAAGWRHRLALDDRGFVLTVFR